MNLGFPSRSVRGKVLAVVMLTTLCALLVAGSALLVYDVSSYKRTWTNDLNTQAQLLGLATVAPLQFDVPGDAQENLDLLRLRTRVSAAAIYNARGALFATYARSPAEKKFPELPGTEGVHVEGSSLVIFQRIVDDGEILGTVFIRADYGLKEKILGYFGIINAATLAALLVAVLVSIRLQRTITRPIQSIAETAREVVEKRDYTLRARRMTEDEVGLLANAFNGMLDEIERRNKELEDFNRELHVQSRETQAARDEVLRLNQELEKRVAERTAQLEVTNQELESFCYSVSHDLRGPLRAIDGFSQALTEELPEDMSESAHRYLSRIRAATLRMGQLIEDLLNLSRVSRGELQHLPVDLSEVAAVIMEDLRSQDPERDVSISIWEEMDVNGDPRLLRAALENLLGNAWKFTSRTPAARIEVGMLRDGGRTVYFVRDNGAGFDMKYVDKLFGAFQRLHSEKEFSGTGIGLATVQRIIHRHGGRIWADAYPGKGAAFFFTLVPENVTTGDRAMN